MKFLIAVMLFSLLPKAFAGDALDQRLAHYIQEFGLEPLRGNENDKPELFQLGRSLFFDVRLSGNKNISCADCHHPRAMTGDGLPLALGEGASGIQLGKAQKRLQGTGDLLGRHGPQLFNLGLADKANQLTSLFWDGRVARDPITGILATPEPELNGKYPSMGKVKRLLTTTLSAQSLFPMVNHQEMRGKPGSNPVANAANNRLAWEEIVKQINHDEAYLKLFKGNFPGINKKEDINIGHVANALAYFQAVAFATPSTPYDRFLKGDEGALNEIQKKGMDIFFGKGKCGSCHKGEFLSDFKFHNIGIPQIGKNVDNGRSDVRPGETGRFAFRTPMLRNVAITGPYMHNGTFKTLAQIVEHYDDIEASLTEYTFVFNGTNYVEKIQNHDHALDALIMGQLSKDLTKKLEFEEWEEGALVEFLNALTDDRILAADLDEDYSVEGRFELRPSGSAKVLEAFTQAGAQEVAEDYFYFDVYKENGYFLRELERPMRIMMVKRGNGYFIRFKEVLRRSSGAHQEMIWAGGMVDFQQTPVAKDLGRHLEAQYRAFFGELYRHFMGQAQLPSIDQLPDGALAIFGQSTKQMIAGFLATKFSGQESISERINVPMEELVFVPTSLNSKKVWALETSLAGKAVKIQLLVSELYDEKGAKHRTHAIEWQAGKLKQSEMANLGQSLIAQLKHWGLNPQDLGGIGPSPAQLTEKILQKVLR